MINVNFYGNKIGSLKTSDTTEGTAMQQSGRARRINYQICTRSVIRFVAPTPDCCDPGTSDLQETGENGSKSGNSLFVEVARRY